jgi:hypothetical protein
MNSHYFTTKILAPLEQKIFPHGRKPQRKRLTIQVDNCSIHTNEATEIFITE